MLTVNEVGTCRWIKYIYPSVKFFSDDKCADLNSVHVTEFIQMAYSIADSHEKGKKIKVKLVAKDVKIILRSLEKQGNVK